MMENLPAGPQITFKSHYLLGGLILCLTVVVFILGFVSRPKARASDLVASNILAAVNKERSLRNALTLNSNDKLSAAAEIKAQDMIVRHYFSHTNPEGNYIWPAIVAQGYTPYTQLGENLAIEFYDTDSLISAWMNSPTHRANILNEGFRDQGMGLSFGSVTSGQYYSSITNTFGTLLVKKTPVVKSSPPPTRINQAPPPQALKKTTPKKTFPTSKKVVAAAQSTVEAPTPAARGAPAHALLAIRGEEDVPSFSLGGTATTAPQKAPAKVTIHVPALSNPKLKINLTVGVGLVFLLLLLLDIRSFSSQNFLHLDKKINNVILLILSLLVCAFLYWM